MVNDEHPTELRFNEAVEWICRFILESPGPVNLVIEAPLSVAFDQTGNPAGRSIEKQGGRTRYWYVGLGCSVMVAALYLAKAVAAIRAESEVRLFEGFVSFKARDAKSDHSRDVELLREVIRDPGDFPGGIVAPQDLRMTDSDRLESAFAVAGIDTGVPPVILRDGQDDSG